MAQSEKKTEAYLAYRAAELGGVALKYHSATSTGYPDRIVLLPHIPAFWCELKSEGERPKPLQKLRISQLNEIGHRAFVCDTREAVDAMLEEMTRKTQQENDRWK